MDNIKELLIEQGMIDSVAGYLSYGIMVLILIIVCIIANLITKKIILKLLTKIIKNNKYIWDDILLERKVFQRVAHIVPVIIVFTFSPAFNNIEELIQRFASTYLLIVSIFIINSVLDSVNDIYCTYPISKVRPMKGLLQVVKIILYIIIGLVGIATLMDKEPLIMLSGIGAFAAVFSFIFKDSILGFIAGIQLTANNMLHIGDWIEMPKYGADGDVIDITLNTVKVQNFDKTIVTIPAYALVSDSFKNWRGMMDFGGRRIIRSINIDMNSIDFCTPEDIEKYKKIDYVKSYIMNKENEIKEYNLKHNIDTRQAINGRHMTNIGTFRAYITCYLNNHPSIHKDLIQMVRQLPPGEYGLPIQIYAFTNDIKWENYESIQADIFDHILSIAEEFGLRVYQSPTGYDVKQINSAVSNL